MMLRAVSLNIDEYEAKKRAYQTVINGKKSAKKHRKKGSTTYHQYFSDNSSFYVVCSEFICSNMLIIKIKTVIIEEGRE